MIQNHLPALRYFKNLDDRLWRHTGYNKTFFQKTNQYLFRFENKIDGEMGKKRDL